MAYSEQLFRHLTGATEENQNNVTVSDFWTET
jgi:hypothetical protein